MASAREVLSRRQERAYDRAAELLKQRPGQLQEVFEQVKREAAADPDLYAPTLAEVKTWHEVGILRPVYARKKRRDEPPELRQVRPPIRDLVSAHLADSERAADDAARSVVRSAKSAAARGGLAGIGVLQLQQGLLTLMARAMSHPQDDQGRPRATLAHVAVRLTNDLIASLSAKKDLTDEERYQWLVRFQRLTEATVRSQVALVEACARLSGRDLASLLNVGATDPNQAPQDAATDSLANTPAAALLEQVTEIKLALESAQDFADKAGGIAGA